jgi:hypothetical protein
MNKLADNGAVCLSVNPALERLRKEDCDFDVSIVLHSLKKEEGRKMREREKERIKSWGISSMVEHLHSI